MTLKKFKNKVWKLLKGEPSNTKGIGVDRKEAKPRPSKKDFREIAEITFKKHEKSFEKLAE